MLRRELAELEPGAFSSQDAIVLAEELAVTENACGVAKVRMASRAAECGEHRRHGFADASDWVAAAAGTTIREARRQLEVIDAVEHCPDTRDALVNGEVSLAQAGEIARTETEVPGCEHELLALARNGSLGAVRDLARKRRVEAIDREDLYARQRKAREFSHWRDDLGMVRGTFALTPEVGVALVNRVEAETDRFRRETKRTRGVCEPRAALAADAFAAILQGTATAKTGAPVVNVVIDWPALDRGHTHPGERSHVVGGGPIPAHVARNLLPNAFVKAVLTNGIEVQRVKHFGRHIPAELRTALELGPPPDFAGVTCDEAGCERRYGLEWDHQNPVANGGATSHENVKPLCPPHHWDKTERDRRAGLLGGKRGERGPPPSG